MGCVIIVRYGLDQEQKRRPPLARRFGTHPLAYRIPEMGVTPPLVKNCTPRCLKAGPRLGPSVYFSGTLFRLVPNGSLCAVGAQVAPCKPDQLWINSAVGAHYGGAHI